jgi:hypothetical protein
MSHITKGAVTSDGPASHLCNNACAHQRQHRYCHLAHFLPGEANVMTDYASRMQLLAGALWGIKCDQQALPLRPIF